MKKFMLSQCKTTELFCVCAATMLLLGLFGVGILSLEGENQLAQRERMAVALAVAAHR